MARPRPTVLTVFGVINIVWGSIGILGSCLSPLILAVSRMMPQAETGNLLNSPAYRVWLLVSAVIGLFSGAALVIAGIGLLRVYSWGRLLSIIWACFSILYCIIGSVMMYFVMFRPMMDQVGASGAQGPAMIGGIIGAAAGMCFGLAYPILVLIFMTRPKVMAAFIEPASEPQIPV